MTINEAERALEDLLENSPGLPSIRAERDSLLSVFQRANVGGHMYANEKIGEVRSYIDAYWNAIATGSREQNRLRHAAAVAIIKLSSAFDRDGKPKEFC